MSADSIVFYSAPFRLSFIASRRCIVVDNWRRGCWNFCCVLVQTIEQLVVCSFFSVDHANACFAERFVSLCWFIQPFHCRALHDVMLIQYPTCRLGWSCADLVYLRFGLITWIVVFFFFASRRHRLFILFTLFDLLKHCMFPCCIVIYYCQLMSLTSIPGLITPKIKLQGSHPSVSPSCWLAIHHRTHCSSA